MCPCSTFLSLIWEGFWSKTPGAVCGLDTTNKAPMSPASGYRTMRDSGNFQTWRNFSPALLLVGGEKGPWWVGVDWVALEVGGEAEGWGWGWEEYGGHRTSSV